MISLNESADELGLDFDISKLCFNQNTDTEMPYNVDYNVISQKLEKLLKHELISVEDVDIVGTYLAKGYDKLTANERSKIDALNLSRIDINENNKYRGIYKYNVQTIEEIFTNEINRVYNKLPNFDGIKLTESDFNGLLLQNNLVGGMFCFVREEAGEYKVSYIAVESVYVDLKDNHFAIYLTMSINGQSVVVNMEIDAPKANGFKVNGTIESLRFGSEMLNNDEITSLLTYLSAAVNDSWITIDADSKSIVVDFTSTLSGIPMFSEIVDFFTVLYPDKQLSTKFVDGTILITL